MSKDERVVLFTIGYEGTSLGDFIATP